MGEKGWPGMKICLGIPLAVVLTLASSVLSWAAPADVPASAKVVGTCDIAFIVTSILHDVSGSARCEPFPVRIARDPSGKEVIRVVEVEVQAAGMDTGNKSRDGQMREMLGAGRFPRIHGVAHDVDVDRLRAEMGKGRDGDASLDLVLRVRDVERKVRAMASHLKESPERVSFDLEFPVSLREFDLKAPSVLGIIRVGDKVSVQAAFNLTVFRSP